MIKDEKGRLFWKTPVKQDELVEKEPSDKLLELAERRKQVDKDFPLGDARRLMKICISFDYIAYMKFVQRKHAGKTYAIFSFCNQ